MTLKLSEILSPVFRDVHTAVADRSYKEFILKGGRGSAKSSYASVEVILQLLQNPEIHAVVMRKVGNTLRTSVYAQYVWAVSALGLADKFKTTVSPMEIIYKRTGQKIMFFGADDPGKIKSIKVPFGYIGILHLEELDQFSGENEVRNIEQSILRGGAYSLEFKTFNPPKTVNNWANQYCLLEKPGQMIHHSTYATTPKEWLGQRFIDDAEYLKEINKQAYDHEYMGIANGTGGMVFDNIEPRTIVNEEIKGFDRLYYGVDWGYYPDPWAFNKVYFDTSRRTLYILGELTLYKKSNRQTADKLMEYGIKNDDLIIADSAENKSIGDYKAYGLYCKGAIKGPGSVDYSMKWLQSLSKILIDPIKCPDTYKEFKDYEYDKTKDGEVISGYPDKNNHHIDAIRYALEPVWKRRGQ